MNMKLQDLSLKSHLFRNAVDDYRDLIEKGTPHSDALSRVGLSQSQWLNIAAAERRAS